MMFDPTVFDHLKTVLEGAIYDEDIAGELFVINREDFVNLALMSRTFRISFKTDVDSPCSATVILHYPNEQLYGEISETIRDPVCHVSIEFERTISHLFTVSKYCKILEENWHPNTISTLIQYDPFQKEKKVYLIRFSLSNPHLISEDQIEDMDPIILNTINSLRELSS
jgi:hypothetical protein